MKPTTMGLLFLAGAACGAAAGLLLAPRAGKETRAELDRWLNEGAWRAGEALGRGRELFEKRTRQVGAAVEAGRKAYAGATQEEAAQV